MMELATAAPANETLAREARAPSPASQTDKLAVALHARTLWAMHRLPRERQADCWPALEAFVAAPGPATYMRAHRMLAQAVRDHLAEAVFGSNQARAFADGLAALHNVAVIPESDLACLERDLPVDALTGTRLADLATLLQIWRELAGRTDEELARLRTLKKLARPSRRG